LIFVHELGHFIAAKKSGVIVERFSLGFGPALVKFRRGETEYCVAAIPLGGYVKMLGEGVDEEEEPIAEDRKPFSFSHQPVGKRIAIVAAGPVSNFVLAILLFAGIFTFAGIPQRLPEVGSVKDGSPAAEAGLKEGDRVLAIEGEKIETWSQLSQTIQEKGDKPLTLEVRRDGEIRIFEVVPEVREMENIFGEPVRRPLIGITASEKMQVRKVNPLTGTYYALVQTWNLCELFVITVVKLIQRILPAETLGGPILIAKLAGEQAREGIVNLLHFTAVISVNLAVLNLLPVPVLDGGHLFFFIIEAVRGKPLSIRVREYAQRVGLVLILFLMFFVIYNDILRVLPGSG
jgi:regulator of sigma E protease